LGNSVRKINNYCFRCSDDLELGIKVSEYKPKKRVKYFPNSHLFFMKPIPVPLIELQQFLSMDLVEKTMKVFKLF